MATLNPAVPVIQPDQNLENFSRGTNSLNLQPLAEVPKLSEKYVQPDYKANTSAGKGLEGFAEDYKADLGLTDAVIKKNANDDLSKSIDTIRDSFGVAAAADQSSGIAPAVGAAGGEGNSLVPTAPAAQPLAVNKLGNKIDGLYEAYQQGGLSNSAFYAKMEAAVKQVKQQYPGYSDDIDQMASSKLGTNPANALRTSLLNDVTELAKKVNGQNDKWQTWQNTNSDAIYRWDKNYDQNKDKYSHDEVYAAVGKIRANEAQKSSDIQSLALKTGVDKVSDDVVRSTSTQHAHDIVNEDIAQFSKQMGIESPQQLQQHVIDINTGRKPLPSADEKDQMRGTWATLNQQADIKLDAFFNTPASDGTTIAGRLGRTAVEDIKAQAKGNLNTIKEGLFDDKTGTMAAQMIWSKAYNDQALGGLLRSQAGLANAKAVHDQMGDSAVSDFFLRSESFRTPLLEAARQYGWGAVLNGGSSLVGVTAAYKSDPTIGDNGDLNRQHIEDTMRMVQDDRNPNAQKNAVQHAFGPDNRLLIESIRGPDGRQAMVPFFNKMVSAPTVTAIGKLDKNSQKTFTNWADDAFTSVFEQSVSDANNIVSGVGKNSNMTVEYDPKGHQFNFKSDFRLPPFAQKQLDGLNSGIASMKEVFKLEGKDPTQALYTLLPVAGVPPGSPIYNALKKEYDKTLGESEVNKP